MIAITCVCYLPTICGVCADSGTVVLQLLQTMFAKQYTCVQNSKIILLESPSLMYNLEKHLYDIFMAKYECFRKLLPEILLAHEISFLTV